MMKKKNGAAGFVLGIFVLIMVLIVAADSFVIIPTGYTGVRTTFGQVSDETVPNGINFKIPFIQDIAKVNNKLQDIEFNTVIDAEASDKTTVYYSYITVTYKINADKSAWIYANVSNYKSDLINDSVVSSAIKTMSKQMSAEDATDRSYIEPYTKEVLQSYVDEKYGENVVTISQVVIGNAYYDSSYEQALSDRQVATQTAETQAITNQMNIDKAEAEAKVKLTEAQAEADALLIQAQAEAEANELLTESLTSEILQQEFIEAWDGALPRVSLADDTSTLFDIGSYVSDVTSGAE